MLSTISGRLTGCGKTFFLAAVVGLLCAHAPPIYAGGAAASRGTELERDAGGLLLAQAEEEAREGRLEPRYEPREPEPKSSYNESYMFGMTRGVADSTIHPAVKAPLFLFTIPLDIVLLPFAAIGGAFG